MPYADAGKFDTGSIEWRDICLARWICELPREYRAEWVGKFAAKLPGLETIVWNEWARRASWRRSSRALDGDAAPAPLPGTIAERGDAISSQDPVADSGDARSPVLTGTSGDAAGAAPRGQLSLV